MSLVLSRREGETWREAATRVATPWGLQEEVAEDYDRFIEAGDSEDEAAWSACYEWDVLEFRRKA